MFSRWLAAAALACTLHADDVYVDGTPVMPGAPYRGWTAQVPVIAGTATVSAAHGNLPRLVLAGPTVLTLDPAGYGSNGVSRISLSYYSGTNSITFSDAVIQYAEAPDASTNDWNTLLIRRAGNGTWKGVGL